MIETDRPDEEQRPEHDLASPPTETGEISTGIGWDAGRDGDRRRPTTAEQAVPWLIGLILALTGIMVVLVALIFTGPEGLAAVPTPSPGASETPGPTFQSTPPVTPAATPTAQPTERVTPPPPPSFGPLEMAYLGRSATGQPFLFWRHDFSTTTAPVAVGDPAAAVTSFAWSPDGLTGAAIVGGHAWSAVSGHQALDLADNAAAIVFGDDSTTLYVLRITPSGANDQTQLLAINIFSGVSRQVASVTYPHPRTFPDPALKESQFGDDGGLDRLYFTIDGYVVAWVLAAPAIYRFDPLSGATLQAARQPVLWSPDQRSRVEIDEVSNTSTNLILRDANGAARATVQVPGVVSHIRWAAGSKEIVFTLGRYNSAATVLQDLYVWDLVDGHDPAPLTSDGLARSAEWLGAPQVWVP